MKSRLLVHRSRSHRVTHNYQEQRSSIKQQAAKQQQQQQQRRPESPTNRDVLHNTTRQRSPVSIYPLSRPGIYSPPPAPRSTPKSCIHSSRERAWWYWRRRWLPLFLFVCCSRPALSRIYARQVDIDELPIVFYQHTFLFIFIFIFVIFFLSLSFLSDFSLMKYGLRHTSIGWFNKIHEDLSLYKPGWCERVSIRLRVRACTNNLS